MANRATWFARMTGNWSWIASPQSIGASRMIRASYRAAVAWIASNDDTEWLNAEPQLISVTAALVCDLFDVPESKLIADLRKAVARRDA
ncbi:hypothetical protein BRAO375_3660052 [Bradyrhizobium sp. ORS 375]|uniref:hypothetical protein n=1 Tax=Bradyrhizobium sp. (strain ORS 375) TaxID=566679 RepID=UPI0002406994|nr:hypothetical protein [Bradyrhizobium sp. ORS 375]CCD94658.1 hypothetical protein BRAO375_3660052 [Bradyrhizobium sp. ORS 375]